MKSYEVTKNKIEKSIGNMNEILNDTTASQLARDFIVGQRSRLYSDLERLKKDTTDLETLNYYRGANLNSINDVYTSVAQYDSVQKTLPAKKRDTWIEKRFRHQGILIRQKYGNDQKTVVNAYLNRFIHYFPQMLFVSLPLFAMILFLLYVRRRIKYYYADHVIYSVHLYCATFIFLFLVIVLGKLSNYPYLGALQVISWLLGLYILYYGYKAMRVFYGQSRLKTVVKYFLLLMMSTFMMSLIFLVYLIFSAFMF